MSATEQDPGIDNLESLLQEKAELLMSQLHSGDIGSALGTINDLQQVKHQVFYNEVGYLTRGLHEAIKSFSEDVQVKEEHEQSGTIAGMSDASDRLNYVIELTEKTSHNTMDRVDTALTLVDKLDGQSTRFKDLLSLVGQLEAEFDGLRGVYDRTCQVKEESEQTIAQLRSELTEILVAQSCQDISGQLIRRVITLLTQVENSLVQLIEMSAKIEKLTGLELNSTGVQKNDDKRTEEKPKPAADPIAAQGPQIGGDSDPNIATSQDDVDELLSSLGF